jgi:hypothetical protein
VFSVDLVARSLFFCEVFYGLLFALLFLFLLVIVLSVLRFTGSDYSSGICMLYFNYKVISIGEKLNYKLQRFK